MTPQRERDRSGGDESHHHRSPASPGLLRNQIQVRSRTDNTGNARLEIVPIEQELAFDKGLYVPLL
jgi:hypothetical protein